MNSGIDESQTKQGPKYQTIISTMSKEKSSKCERKGRRRNLTSISYEGNENNRQRRGNIRKRKRKRKRRGRPPKDGAEVDEASRLQRRARNLMIKMKFEQNLIDAYSAEGWKGQSREKVRPQHELQRAMNQILKCKLGIRDAIHQLDLLSSEGCIEDSAIAPDGSVYHENEELQILRIKFGFKVNPVIPRGKGLVKQIFCAKCKLREAFPDNDIILCDGTCNCAFHQKCLDPPLLTKDIPQGDEGWFCKLCECKMDILEAMNAHIGTHFSVASNWQEIFKEEAALTTDGRGNDEVLHMEEEWPSDESDDDDFDPEKFESQGRAQSDDNVSESASNLCLLDGDLLIDSSSSDDDDDNTTDCEILSGRRQRRAVDYKKLYHEMFGKDAPVNEPMSEDEDWGPSKRKRREKESDAASTLITLCEIENQWSNEENIINNDNDNNNNSNSNNNDEEDEEDRRNSSKKTRRISFRLPTHAVEKLRCVFAENELPSKAVRDELSEQLGLDSEKVNKWFKNARYLALKARKQLEGQKSLLNISPRMSMEAAGLEVGEKNPTDKMLSKDMVTFGVMEADKVQICNILKKQVDVQNNFELLTTPPDKRHPVETKAAGEFGDDVSLKLVKEKAKREKRVEFEVDNSATIVQKSEAEAEAEADMERLCKIESKVQRLQQLLLRLPNRSRDPTACVVYVPIAELKEKN